MTTSANADLTRALHDSFRTVASVTNQRAASQCIERATSYWLSKYKQQSWHIITVDLTLLTNVIYSVGSHHMAQKSLGILQQWHLETFDEANSLFIYSTDKYTENWVHEWVASKALSNMGTNRVLNVQRDDKGPILDLGPMS